MSYLNQINRIVLIADDIPDTSMELTIYDRDLDKPHPVYVKHLLETLSGIHSDVIFYDNPKQLVTNIKDHNNDLIFPFWFGENSRNRHALIPAICEASDIKYVGADAYTKIVCNDKHISKLLCKEFGLHTPKFCIWSSVTDTYWLDKLSYPCVVKPVFEGTSLGIGHRNLVSSPSEASVLAAELKNEFKQPILIEEFIPGLEVSICLVGQNGIVKHWAASERYMEEDENYFVNKLYTYEEKKSETLPLALRDVSKSISDNILKCCFSLFQYLGKVEFMRIDGKLSGSSFSVIELTPDTHLGEDSEFAGTFISTKKHNYTSIISLLVDNSLEGYQNQSANM